MLVPQNLLRVVEFDAMYVVTPTSRFDHSSDTVLATVEMLIENDQQEEIEFPFYILNADPGTGAASTESVAPHVLNGSQPVAIEDDEIDEVAFAELMVERARQQGTSDERVLGWIRRWAEATLAKAERVKVGRTKISPGARRRIILQQRIRLLPDAEQLFVFEVLAPPPLGVIPVGGRISVIVIFPWEDQDVRTEIVEKTEGFEVELGRVKMRPWVGWHWQNDPLLRVVYRYV